ncbi:MAG TPA: glycosyl hydrolase, partial [Cyclobacteriaceae bacterium]
MKRLLPILLLFLFSSLIFAQNQLTSQTLSGLKLRNIGPAIMSGRIVDLAVVESNPITFYVATATGGLWKTTNNGITFTPVFQNEGTHSIGAIAVHQKSSKFVWVGTGERANRQSSSWGDGIYLSSNSGRSWKNIGLKDSHHIGRIVLHPEDTGVAYVAAMGHLWGPNPERGLYKTSDGGKSWVQLLYVDENTGVVDVAMDPSDPNILYCATYQRRRTPYGFDGDGPGSALYKSADAGKTWRKIHNGLPAGEYGRIGISIYR